MAHEQNDSTEAPQLDPSAFSLSDYGSVRAELPAHEVPSEADIDAQLFGYLMTFGKDSGATSLADVDDAWVKANFGDVSSVEELRGIIRRDLEMREKERYGELAYRLCAEELVGRLQGDIPDDVLDAAVESSRESYDARLRAMGTTKTRYMRDNSIAEEEYEREMREDIAFQMKLNIALDKMVLATGTAVAAAEIPEYLSTDDPDAFMEQLRETGRVDEARAAAARVKLMRRIMEAAEPRKAAKTAGESSDTGADMSPLFSDPVITE